MAEKPDSGKETLKTLKENAKREAEAVKRQEAADRGAKKRVENSDKKREAQTKVLEAMLEVDKLRAAGDEKNADRLEKKITKYSDAIEATEGSNINAQVFEELIKGVKTANDDTASRFEALDTNQKAFIEKEKFGITNLAERIKEQTAAEEASDGMVEKALGKLDGFGMGANENSRLLREEFQRAQELEASGRAEDIKAAQEIKAAVISAASDEEKRREAEELAEEQNSNLIKIADGFNNFADKYGDTAKSAVKTAGFLGVIAALIFGAVDPEKLMKLVDDIVKGFLEIIEGFMAFISGDTEKASELLGKNWKLLLGAITGVALWFAGPIIKIFGSMFTMLNKVMKVVKFFRITAIAGFVKNMVVSLATMAKDLALGALKKVVAAAKAFRIFSLTTMVPALLSTFSAIVAAMVPVIAAVWPVVAIIGVIAAAFMLIKNYLGEGASITDTLKYAMLLLLDGLGHIVNAFTFIPRKIFGFFGERIGKFLLGDDFKMPDFITKGMKTNRASEFKAEIDARPKKPDTAEIDGEIKEQQDLELPEGVEIPENLDGAMILDGDDALDSAKIAVAQGGATVNAPQITANTQQNTQSTTNISYNPPSFGTMQLITHYTGRA